MISFIIPTFNEAKAIEATLQSLRRYTGECEIIVSDDGSLDSTREIAQRYADKVLLHVKKEGIRPTIGANRNNGAREAQGEFIVFIDSDTYIKEDPNVFFKTAFEVFEKDPEVLALTVFVRVTPSLETLGDKIGFGLLNFTYLIRNNILRIGGASGKFQMIRREAFLQVGGFDENLAAAEDDDLFRRLSRVGKTRTVAELSIYHSGRRGHAIGWPKLLSLWFLNAVSSFFLKKSVSKVWTEVR